MKGKILKITLIIICVIALILPSSTEVLAKITETAKGTTQTFGITLTHASKTMDGNSTLTFGYRVGTRNTYRVYSGSNDYETTVLCLNQTGKFPQETDDDGNKANEGSYTSQGEATATTLSEANSNIDSEDAAKIAWLIENALLPEDSEELREQKLSKIFNDLMESTSTTANPLTLSQIKSVLTEDDVVFALQLALWQLTDDLSTKSTIEGTADGTTWDGLTGDDMWGYNGTKGTYINTIVSYYNDHWAEGTSTDTTTKTDPSFKETTVTTTVSGAYAYIGPFYINEATNYYSVDVSFEDATEAELSDVSYLLVDAASSEANVLTQTKEGLEGKEFYVRVRVNTKATKVKIQLTTQVTVDSTGTVWSTGTSTDQNLLTIERKETPGTSIPYEGTIEIKLESEYDASLRKYISKIYRETATGSLKVIWDSGTTTSGYDISEESREPEDVEATSDFNDYDYNHKKDPMELEVGDLVEYTILVTNECENNLIVSKITDYAPPSGLEYVEDNEINETYSWIYSKTENSYTTDYRSKTVLSATSGKLPSEVSGSQTEVKIVFEVTEDAVGKIVTNIAEIAEIQDENQKAVTDHDSIINNINLPTTEEEWEDYAGNETDNKEDLSDSKYYYKGQEDDDDFEKITVKATEVYDLALKKFITTVTSSDGTAKTLPEEQQREITVTDVTELINRENDPDSTADAEYELNKTPVEVAKGDYVIYTIRIYNEGTQDAIVKEIVDTLPEGIEFVTYETNENGTYKSGSATNYKYGWTTFTDETSTGWTTGIKTTYLDGTTISAFDASKADEADKGLSYVDVQVEFKVVTSKNEQIKNIAEITDDDGDDNDSTPNNKEETEDDEDYDIIIPQTFDLALRKFITQIDETEVTDREPQVAYNDEDEKLEYTHTKEPKVVVKGNIVTYTLRIYNEGTLDGYAEEITDDLPEGITFLPKNETNIEYRWKMYDDEGNETDDVTEAVTIKTDYLSKEQGEARQETSDEENPNLLKAFDAESEITEDNPDYLDIKVVFEVTQDSVTASNKTIINTAEISDDADEDGNEVDDIDSTPGNGVESEDDIDKEYLVLKYFDLALSKYVSKVIVTEDGVTNETETGYDGTENPEPVVKVELNRKKLDTTEVKYVYTIKITNQGEIEGYATEIKDRIPDGLAFYEEDNTEYGWTIEEEGIVTTDYLKDTLLEPGESATVQIVLRWERDENNLGQKVNVAEISDDYNEYGTPDIDSTPDNNVDGEDDQDDAIVVLSISTGSTPLYIALIIATTAILVSGCYLIYTKVIKE